MIDETQKHHFTRESMSRHFQFSDNEILDNEMINHTATKFELNMIETRIWITHGLKMMRDKKSYSVP